ncbi:MAG: 50S ribosomal protein L25 [Patescibacteria group bacterium]
MTDTSTHIIHVLKRADRSSNLAELRANGLVPANVYGEGKETVLVSFPQIELQRLVAAGSDAALLYLKLDDTQDIPVLIEEIQNHPVQGNPLHVSFKRVNLKEKVTAEVAVEIEGEFDVPGANLVQVKDILEVEALPADIPDSITLDVSTLTEIGQTLHLADAIYDRDKVSVILTEEELEEPLVVVQEVKEEVEEETPEGEEADEATEGATDDEDGGAESESKENASAGE